MKIEIKPIKIKNNEWIPQEQIFFSQEIIQEIINEEELKNNMICKQGIGFDTINQTFTNVVFDCEFYNSEFIYLIKSKEIIKDREWFFAYVTNKTWNTTKKVILELTIDTITSNYDLFENKSFKGQAYIERTNNYQREINNFHSSVCSDISPIFDDYQETNTRINRKIDIFIDVKSITRNDIKIKNLETGQQYTTHLTTYGSVINEGEKFYAFASTINLNEIIKDQRLPFRALDELLFIYAVNSKIEDNTWKFHSTSFFNMFIENLKEYGHDGTQLDQVVAISQSGDINNSWQSVPKIFGDFSNAIYSSIEYVIKELPNFDLKNHIELHYDYYIIVGATIKIPIDLLKIKNKTIYIDRIISVTQTTYKFYYNKKENEPFYQINMPFTNGMNNNTYRDYQREKDNSYQSGAVGVGKTIQDLLQSVVTSLPSFIAGAPFGFVSLTTGIIASSFNNFKEARENYYKAKEITQKGNTSISVLSTDIIKDFISSDITTLSSVANIYIEGIPNVNNYTIFNQKKLDKFYSEFITLNIKKPIKNDIDKIINDQFLYGNIVNQTFLDLENPLLFNELTKNHLYWQGKILPDVNPIDNFQLDILNQALAKGIFIYKLRQNNKTISLNNKK